MKVINESEKEEKIAKKCYNFFLIILIHRNKGIRVKLIYYLFPCSTMSSSHLHLSGIY